MFNLAILTGRLTADPELKTTPNGVSVTSFSIAVDRRHRSGEERQTDFINIVAWRQTAEFITHYFTKGSLIGIEGSIQTRRYQDKDGNNRTVFEVVANNVDFVMPKSAAERAATEDTDNSLSEPQSFSNANVEGFEEMDVSDDDLPF